MTYMKVGVKLPTHFVKHAVWGVELERSVRIYSIYKEDIPEDFDISLLYDILYADSNEINTLYELLKIRGSYLEKYDELGSSIRAYYNVRYSNFPYVNESKIERLKLFQCNVKLTNF